MATFANLSDIVATTIQSRSAALADNVTNNNALLSKLRERGNVKPFSGGNVILQELMYNDTSTENAGSYSGYDIIDITPNSPISAAQFDIKQYAAAVSINGLEMLQNSGKEQIIDLLEGRIQVAEAQLENDISAGIYSDGTGNGGKDITGLALAVAASPGSGTYGGINRTNFSFWRNIAFDATTDGGAAASAANMQSYMNRVAVQLVRGSDRPDMIVAGNNYYRFYLESLCRLHFLRLWRELARSIADRATRRLWSLYRLYRWGFDYLRLGVFFKCALKGFTETRHKGFPLRG